MTTLVHTGVSDETVCSSGELPKVCETSKATAEVVLSMLYLEDEERRLLEEKTRTQSSNSL